ncbi:MAG: valine--tRNA ligase [Anaerolineales bacterium]
MSLSKRYHPQEVEPRLEKEWQASGVYDYKEDHSGPVYSIDSPPATVSGNLHLGHVYSYSHADFMARFFRMRGKNVFYPMGFDDNGLPTERLVEKQLGITATQVGRTEFIRQCLQVSQTAEKDYRALWQRLGLSIDWRYTYRTIDDFSRRTSQYSFIQLYQQGLVYHREAPAIWCPECHTAIAQAELNDLDRQSEYVTLDFHLEGGGSLPIATTRPELLPACVAIFIHPGDSRYRHLVGKQARVPLFGQIVPIMEDAAADPDKGTGAVMCCTFGDSTDVTWWYTHQLPLVESLGRDGKMTAATGEFNGLPVETARQAIKARLETDGLMLGRQPTLQSIRVHERCDTPVEYIVTTQWFIHILNERQKFLELGDQVAWHPAHMQARYRAWVENLNWDWCISRQRYFGVPFPLWYCQDCGEVILADEAQLPIDPTEMQPLYPCPTCGGEHFTPEEDVFDTWATSSLTPQIVGRWLEPGPTEDGASLFRRVFPFSLRPQAHEIIRTWTFYTIVKSYYHLGQLPWHAVLISGWGLAGEGMGKISKSRGGGPMTPLAMLERHSADALRYWAASTAAGKDALISEDKIRMGSKLVTKLWNVARFCERFLQDYRPPTGQLAKSLPFTPADRWILARLQHLIRRATTSMENYDYASAKSEVETFFWTELADNYLEMSKQRLYEAAHPARPAALYSLYQALLTILKLLAPFLPYVSEEIYQGLFASTEDIASIHRSQWPQPIPELEDENAADIGQVLLEIATCVRRFKSEHNLPLGTDLPRLQLATFDPATSTLLEQASVDLRSVTRALQIEVVKELDPGLERLNADGTLQLAVEAF